MEQSKARSRVGQLIRQRRKELKISQSELAARTGIEQRTISRIENSGRPEYLPEPHLLVPIARELGLSVADLVSAAGYPVDDEAAPPQPGSDPQIYTRAMEDIDRLELPERVKRMMREAVEYARELAEREMRKR